MKNILLVIGIIGIGSITTLQAQLFPLMYNTRDNAFIINPAMTGIPLLLERNTPPKLKTKTIAGISSRLQWTNFGEDSPITHYARIQHRLQGRGRRNTGKSAWLGGYIVTDRTGPLRLNLYGVNASYHLYLSGQNYLHFGLSVRLATQNLDQNRIVVNGDPFQDEVIANNLNNSNTFLSSGFGVFYSGEFFYAGISIPQTTFSSSENADVLRLSNHFFANGGLYIPLTSINRDTYIEPAIWIRTASEISALFDVSVKYRSILKKSTEIPYWVGIGFDTNNSVRAELGGKIQKLKVNIIYNYYFGGLSDFGSGLEGGVSILLN